MSSASVAAEPALYVPLSVYRIETDDGEAYDWVAEDVMDALKQHMDDVYGGTVDEYLMDYPLTLRRMPDDMAVTIDFPPTSCDPEGRPSERRTLGEWTALRGRGLLCSTVDESR